MTSDGSRDTEGWSNDTENSGIITFKSILQLKAHCKNEYALSNQ